MTNFRSEKYKKIIRYLENNSPDKYSPGLIATRLKINPDTAKSYCSRLAKAGKIIKTYRGEYRAKLDTDTLKRVSAKEDIDIRLHGIKLQGRLCTLEGTGYFPGATAKNLVYEDNYRSTYQYIYEGRKTTITFHHKGKGKGLVEVFLKTSKNSLSINEFFRWEAYLHGLFPDMEVMDFKLIQVGLNCDYRRLRLDGVKNIRLQTFKNAWFQIYQKAEDILRIEGHLVTDITLAEAIDILAKIQKPQSIRIKPESLNNDPMYL